MSLTDKLTDQDKETLFEIYKFLNNIYPWDNFDDDLRESLAEKLGGILERLE
jgi:hypothetical protein